MNVETMKQSGALSNAPICLNDGDLELAIIGTKMALAYMEGRGRSYFLASHALAGELEVLLRFRSERDKVNKD